MHFFFFVQVYRALKSCYSLLENVSLRVSPSKVGTSHCLVFVPLIRTVLLLGAPMLSTRWVKIPTCLQSGPFLSIIFILNIKLLKIFVHNPNVLCYVGLRYHVLVISLHFRLFVCLYTCLH
jgi:hypothetical protein